MKDQFISPPLTELKLTVLLDGANKEHPAPMAIPRRGQDGSVPNTEGNTEERNEQSPS